MSTITLAIMARNAGATLDGAISPVLPYVDEVVILLGGESEDNTEEIARKYTENVFPFEWCDDFSAARNALMSHCTSDWIFWIDADDVAENPELLREVLADAEKKDWGTVQMPYEYAFDDNGNCIVKHDQHRLLRRDLNWEWGCTCRGQPGCTSPYHPGRVHEVCYSDTDHAIGFDQRITIVHQRPYPAEGPETGQTPRNLRLLLIMEKEAPRCRRTRLAMAHCLFGMSKWQEALFYFQAYYQEPESQLECWHAACFAAKCCWNLNKWPDMANWAAIAIELQPEFKDGYLLRAQAEWWGKGDPTRTLTWILNARDKLPAPMAVFVTPLDYTINAWDIEHRCYHALGMNKEALAVVEQARQIIPNHEGWDFFDRLYREAVRSDRSVSAAIQLADHLVRLGDVLKAGELLRRYLPHNIEPDKRIVQLQQRVSRMTEHLHDPTKYRAAYNADAEHGIKPSWLWARFSFVEERFDKLQPKRVLDIACGGGLFDIHLATKYGCEVVGIDISDRAIEIANENLAKEPKKIRKLVTFVCGDPQLMDMDALGKFDVALMLEILEHMAGPDAQRILGIAEDAASRYIATVPAEICIAAEGIEDDHSRLHVRCFSMYELLELLAVRSDRRVHSLYKRRDPTQYFIPGFGTWVVEWDMRNVDMPKIVFYLGHGPEPWEPSWIDGQGLGGSETAAVKMAEEFAAAGFSVVVYAGFEGIVNGVIYQYAEAFNPALPYLNALPAWLMVGSRIPEMAAYVNAQHRWLWMHDVECPSLNEKMAEKIDRIVVLSDWHADHVRKTYPFLKPDHLIVSGDGIHAWVSELQEPQAHRFVYASSPDRGLDVLLTWWPAILKKWKDAELHVFYGWNNYDQMMRAYPQMGAFKEHVQRLLAQPGVTMHGRIGQKELAAEFAKSQFWLYPSIRADGKDWEETFCITALEAQANGCIPIVRPVGALPERCVYKESLVKSRNVKDFLKRMHWWAGRKDIAERRAHMAYEAQRQTWERVATQWLAVLNAEERRRLTQVALEDEKEVPVYA
jgi:SAM-dependent methyltransferase/glycosyltransferase involved in cell wall biosynthesis